LTTSPDTGVPPVAVAIVEDDPRVRESLRELLQSGGYETLLYANAEDFLSDTRRTRAAALISDIGLSGITGLDLLRALRAESSRLPVVLMTGRRDPKLESQARELGAARLFYKPFDAAEILATLRRIITSRP
jgi:two-component system response regulator FixJ